MSIPECVWQDIQSVVESVNSGRLPEFVLVNEVIENIVDYQDASVLEKVPENIKSWIEGMISEYKENGEVFFYTSLGAIDKTDLIVKLIDVLEK